MQKLSRNFVLLVAPAAVALMAGCDPEFTLQVLHSSDNESAFQDPNTLEPKVLHYGALVNGLEHLGRREQVPTLHLTAGDHTLPGPFYQASAQVPALGANGIGDIELYNAMHLTANGMGNHEFDGGIDEFAEMLARADYPFLAVNLDFSEVSLSAGTPAIEIGQDGQSVVASAGKVVKSAWVEVHRRNQHGYVTKTKVGLIGRAPAEFFNVIKDPDTTLPGLDFVGGRDPDTNQPLESAVDQVLEQVDVLEAQGINKIVLLDHAQDFTSDPLSASALRGVDIIVAAGSTGFMARPQADGPFNWLRPGDTAQADYPTLRDDSEGFPVAVVNSDQIYRYIGNLMVTFDGDGHVADIDERSGPIATTADGVARLADELGKSSLEPTPAVRDIYDSLAATDLIQEQFEEVGSTTSVLQGDRAAVRSRETNLGRLAADSTLWIARREFPAAGVDLALKNGGGLRATIQGPTITRLTIGAALAFDNQLAVVDLTAAELIAVFENAVSRVPALDGRFPQVAGVELAYDASRPGVSDAVSLDTPSRVQRLVITRDNGTTDVLVDNYVAQGDLGRFFTVATNDFLLTGGDGYQALRAAFEARGALTPSIGEREVMVQYIQTALGGIVDLPEPLLAPRVVRLD
ncbi:MAG: bifunctional metallophosphatase/5'-nucleotidase [Myxococcales bacterium FL481]|nr:MAG: bifunctional metallophosphatase/5'-nucleotidase [Myxococcales bacterium FL481]